MIGFRLGELPKNEKSINYMKLTADQREDVWECSKDGGIDEQIDFLIENTRTWRGVNKSDIFHDGVSVFACENKLPNIANIDQARSLSVRLDDVAYIVTGDLAGYGQDGEPLLKNCTAEKAMTTTQDLINLLIGVLSGAYADVAGQRDDNEADCIRTFYDETKNEKHITFAGLEFRKPISKEWEL